MRQVIVTLFLILICSNIAVAQKRSDAQELELTGPVKVVRAIHYSFHLIEGKYVESGKNPTRVTQVFDRKGTKLFEQVDVGEPICGYMAPDNSKRTYDQNGTLIEYLPNDTIEHSGYRLRHIYDSIGRRVETEEYDPYKLLDKWAYKYEAFDERGNWIGRRITRTNAVNGRFARTIVVRSIDYY